MLQIAEAKNDKGIIAYMESVCRDLYREWEVDLTLEEKEVWLWNAAVEMDRIKRRRKS